MEIVYKEGIDRMKVYKKIMDVIAECEKIVVSAVLVFVTVITFINVLVRKLTTSQFAWSEELVINLFVLLIMLGCALCVRDGSLITLSLVFDRLKLAGKKVLVIICTVADCVFWAFIFKAGYDKVLTVMANGKLTSSLRWPEWVFQIFLPIGAVFLLLHTIEYCIDFMSAKPEVEGGQSK